MVVQCCVCKSIRDSGKWKKKPVSEGQQVSHTYCPHCLDKESAKLVAQQPKELVLT